MLTAYAYPKCSTCRKALKWLADHGHEPRVIDITAEPPPATLLRSTLKTSDYQLKDLFNRSGELYRELNMKDRLPAMSEDEAIQLLSEHGKLCKRPIVTDGKRVTVGFDETAFARTWSR